MRPVPRACRTRRPHLGALLAVLLLAGGCTGDPGTAAPAPPPANTPASTPVSLAGVDAPFLTAMVAHTERTLEIVRLVEGRVTDAQLRTLLDAIEATESDELRTVRTWLRDAGRPTSGGAHDHAGHAGADDLARLRAAAPADVDRELRAVLGAHQRAAADLAHAHLTVGGSAPVRELAERVARSRTAQTALLTDG
ncbi:DUF305 domain-containing protein [Micromonospora sp. NPDC047707]|uniref:DUF305 domain-containing protein n=1 Tax=Micromonospora sp. NPDC047707 TaxID=3154498 RepID=UPI003452990C